MKIHSKDSINDVLGKYGWLESAGMELINKAEYLGGIADLDVELKDVKRGHYSTHLAIKPKGIQIALNIGFFSYRVPILMEQIEFVVIEAQNEIIERKSKSVVGRALVGGLLLGPVGAIVGGLSGVGSKEKNLAEDNILTIKIADSNFFISFSIKNKNLMEVESYFKKHFGPKFKSTDELEQINSEVTPKLSVADELLKLKSLLDCGLLTAEEFEIQKQRIINSNQKSAL